MLKRFRVLLAALLLAVPAASAADLSQAMADVERLRGLTFVHGVAQKTLDRKNLRSVLRREIAKSLPYSPADYARVLTALQLVDKGGPDLIEKMLDLYESQVLAFYDPVSHTYFAINGLPDALKGVAGADALAQSVVVHELTHALQDQLFDASQRDLVLRDDVDAQLAYHALLEGEASLVMMAWLLDKAGQPLDTAIKNDMMLSLMSSAAAADKTVTPGTPPYFVESLKFPYIDGLKLVINGYRRGGWKAIDRMHMNPPRSTREVIHSDEYFARLDRGDKERVPFDERFPDADTLTIEHLGEFHWRYLVGDAATGWVNDRVEVGCDGLVIAETAWDSADHAAAFSDAYAAFLRNHAIDAAVKRDGTRVTAAYLAP